MRNLKLSRAWEQWQFWYEEMMRQQFLLGGALNRMRNFHLSRAWEKWQFEYERKKHQMFLIGGAVHRMLNFHLSRAWERWQYWYFEKLNTPDLFEGAIRRMQNLLLSRAYNKWTSICRRRNPEEKPKYTSRWDGDLLSKRWPLGQQSTSSLSNRSQGSRNLLDGWKIES